MTHTTAQPEPLARDLARLLTEMAGQYAELVACAREKIEAMRRADSEAMTAITGRELLLAQRIAQREGLRRQITRKLAECCGFERTRADALRIADLADRIEEPYRNGLLAAGAALRQNVEELQRLQQVSALITHEMLKHFGEVVLVMRGAGLATEHYTRGGRRAEQPSASVFEAVG